MPPAMRLAAKSTKSSGRIPRMPASPAGAAVAGELRARFVRSQRHQVHRRRADEGGDESRRRLLVDVERIADLLDLAAVHHHENVGQRHRLELVVGDVDRGRAAAAAAVCGSRRAWRCAAWRRGSTAARRTETPSAAARWRGPWRRAGAGRRRAAAACGRASAPSLEDPRGFAARASRSRAPACGGCAGRRPCCCRRSYADRARSSGTPWRCRGRPARSR